MAIKKKSKKTSGSGMNGGFSAVKRLKDESDARRSAYSQGYTPFFSMSDGETLENVWFNGTDAEPHITAEHSIRDGKNFVTITCAKGVEDHDGCVACYRKSKGDAKVSFPAKKAAFNVADPRFVHKVKNEQKSTGDRERFDFISCPGKMRCKLCKKGDVRERAGQKRWVMSMTWAMALGTINERLQRKCECGGKVRNNACSSCDNPRPMSIFAVPFTITRSGSGTSTTYQFIPGAPCDPPAWVAKLEPADLAEACAPQSAERQAARMGVDNPFDEFTTSKKRKGGDDDDEEESLFEEDDDDDEDDDEDEGDE